MSCFHPICVIRVLVAAVSIIALGAPSTAKQDRSEARVRLVEPFEHASAPESSPMLAYKFADLARIDPDHPLANEMARQTLSLFGREDLIANGGNDYKSTRCARLESTPDVFAAIVARARETSIVVINESHERSEHRGFTAEVVKRLRSLGNNTLAIETLSNPLPGTAKRYLPTFLRQTSLPYLVDEDGFYLSEAGFGRLGRIAKALGYRLLPYEFNEDSPTQTLTQGEQIASREEGQARNLASFLKDHPATKLLVHVGYSHATEVTRADGAKWMAARLKQKTGIDPLTISQTTCRGAGDTLRLSALPADEPAGTFDLVVDHPGARFERGRPEWRKLAGDIAVSIPQVLQPAVGWRVVEARVIGEPATSVPMDRVAIRPGEDIALMLPPGRYHVRIIDPAVANKFTLKKAQAEESLASRN